MSPHGEHQYAGEPLFLASRQYLLLRSYPRRYYSYMAPRLSVTETVNTFKNCLDKFWSDQEVLCCKIDLHGIGNRSIV